MQNKPSNDQHKNIYYRLRRSDPHERLSARLRHFSFGAAVFFVVAAAGIVTHSLYNIQIKQGATFRQYAAQQQLLDSTIQATRGEIYDASGITLASTSVVWTIWADPSYSTALFTSQTVEETGEGIKTVDETTLADVSRRRRESGQRRYLFGRISDPVPDRPRRAGQERVVLSGSGHQGEQCRQALHREIHQRI